MAVQTKTQLKAIVNAQMTDDRVIWASLLREVFINIIDSVQFDYIIDSTGELTTGIPLADKKEGIIAKVKGTTGGIFQLESDLTTWTPIYKGQYSNTAIDDLLNEKVNIVAGKGLSTQDFTTELLEKLNGIEEGATKVTAITDIEGLVSALEDMLNIVSGFQEQIDIFNENLLVSKKAGKIINADYSILLTDHTILVNCTGGNVNIYLPDTQAENVEGKIFIIKKISSGEFHPIIQSVDPDDSASDSASNRQQLIFESSSGVSSITANDNIARQYQCIESNWYKIN